MGKTSRPLSILAVGRLGDWPEFAALREQGHTVHIIPPAEYDVGDYDLILGERCWRMLPELRDYLDMAIKAARKAKYGKGAEGEVP